MKKLLSLLLVVLPLAAWSQPRIETFGPRDASSTTFVEKLDSVIVRTSDCVLPMRWKTEYLYDSKGRTISLRIYVDTEDDGINSGWQETNRETWEYKGDSYTYFSSYKSGNKWVNSEKKIYETNGKMYSLITYNLESGKEKVTDGWKIEETNDGNLRYTYKNGKWEFVHKEKCYTLQDGANVKTAVTEYWIGSSCRRFDKKYANGLLTRDWWGEGDGTEWHDGGYTEYAYDSHANIVSIEDYKWEDGDEPQPQKKIEKNFDSKKRLIAQTYYVYKSGKWVVQKDTEETFTVSYGASESASFGWIYGPHLESDAKVTNYKGTFMAYPSAIYSGEPKYDYTRCADDFDHFSEYQFEESANTNNLLYSWWCFPWAEEECSRYTYDYAVLASKVAGAPGYRNKLLSVDTYNLTDCQSMETTYYYSKWNQNTVKTKGISLDKASMTLSVGEEGALTPTLYPSNATDKSVTWTSNNTGVATVSAEGVVKAVGAGSCPITATTNDGSNLSESCIITVVGNGIKVTGLSLSPAMLSLVEGETGTITPTIYPSKATDKTLTWTSNDTKVATVSSTGVVTAVGAGSCRIKATTNDGTNISEACIVTVTAKSTIVLATGISLSNGSLTLTEGETSTLTATIYPSKATDKTVTWTTNDTKVATVSSKGVVTAVGAGTCRIKATTNDGTNLSEECLVTVKASVVKATSISLNRNELTLTEGETSTLKATVGPSDATDQTVSWRSSNTAVATVSSKGVVSAKGAGSCTITATTNDGTKLTDDCQVTVTSKEIPVSKITLSAKDVTIVKGETLELVATISPADATIQTLVWESADNHVVMVENGLVYAIAAGSTYVTAHATDGSGVEASCLIEVIEPKILVTGIDLDCTAIMMHVDDQCTIEATVYPEEADNKNLVWTSSDIHVAMVAEGFVKATGEGNCVITATATDGSEVYAECEVIVMQGIGISAIEDDEAAAMIYNLDGTRASQLRQGILLFRRNDGRVEKVLVK